MSNADCTGSVVNSDGSFLSVPNGSLRSVGCINKEVPSVSSQPGAVEAVVCPHNTAGKYVVHIHGAANF